MNLACTSHDRAGAWKMGELCATRGKLSLREAAPWWGSWGGILQRAALATPVTHTPPRGGCTVPSKLKPRRNQAASEPNAPVAPRPSSKFFPGVNNCHWLRWHSAEAKQSFWGPVGTNGQRCVLSGLARPAGDTPLFRGECSEREEHCSGVRMNTKRWQQGQSWGTSLLEAAADFSITAAFPGIHLRNLLYGKIPGSVTNNGV